MFILIIRKKLSSIYYCIEAKENSEKQEDRVYF